MKKALFVSIVASAYLCGGGDIQPVEPTVETPVSNKASAEFLIFSDITPKGEIRPRYEYVEASDNGKDDASAFTNRLMLGIQAKLFQIDGLSTYIEATNVTGTGDYWDLSNDNISKKPRYQVVADPDQTRITQAYIDYKSNKTLIRAGRQGVNLDNQRFIGTVNWRQMPQTYDAVALNNKSIENFDLLAAYIWRVNRIFDKDSVKRLPWSDDGSYFDTSSILLHASYTFMPALTLTGYGYLLEDIHDTVGIAATGKVNIFSNTKLTYRAEYAQQTDPSLEDFTTDKTADASYYNIKATSNTNGLLAGVGYEVLGAGEDGNAPFTTPLATLHAHNGWADMFLSTPADGLVDLSGMLGYNSKEFGVSKIIYHDFSSDKGDSNYGTEIDVLYKNKIPGIKGLSGMLKAAWYNAEDYGVDTTKFWVMLGYKF